MDFSEKLVNKIHTHRINPVIVFIIFSITVAVLIGAVSNGIKFDMSTIIMMGLSISLLFSAWIASRIIKTNNFELGKIEDFVILNSENINKINEHHNDMLSMITNFETLNRVINSEIIIKKFQHFLDE